MDWHGNPGDETCSQLLGVGLGRVLYPFISLSPSHTDSTSPFSTSPRQIEIRTQRFEVELVCTKIWKQMFRTQ